MPLFESMRGWGQSPAVLKVRSVTDENEKMGATGTLMNEITVLTYNAKTVREITQVLNERLTTRGRRAAHKSSIQVVKTLTLVLYLINNGSEEFIAWVRGNLFYFGCFQIYEPLERRDEPLAKQIRSISKQICECVNDDEILEWKRKEIVAFKSSISSPGYKSTDNSHLKGIKIKRNSRECKPLNPTSQLEESIPTTNEYQSVSNQEICYRRNTTSLYLRRKPKTIENQVTALELDPIEGKNEGRTATNEI